MDSTGKKSAFGGFKMGSFKEVGSGLTNAFNKAGQKSKEAIEKLKDKEYQQKLKESTKKSTEGILKGANKLWNEAKTKTVSAVQNMQGEASLTMNLPKPSTASHSPAAVSPSQPTQEEDLFDITITPVVSQPMASPAAAPAQEEEEDLFDLSAPAVVSEPMAAAPAQEEEEEEDLFDMSAPAVTVSPAQPVQEEEEDLFDMSAAATTVSPAQPVQEEEEDLFDMSAAATTVSPAVAPAQPAQEEDLFDMSATAPIMV
ncbi:hypothetical protein WA158_007026 [Blastocystis sp. Blastoise]